MFYANVRSKIDWLNMELTVNQCAQVAVISATNTSASSCTASATVAGMLRKVMPNTEPLLKDAGCGIINLICSWKRGDKLCVSDS